jgi:hypothetical protein
MTLIYYQFSVKKGIRFITALTVNKTGLIRHMRTVIGAATIGHVPPNFWKGLGTWRLYSFAPDELRQLVPLPHFWNAGGATVYSQLRANSCLIFQYRIEKKKLSISENWCCNINLRLLLRKIKNTISIRDTYTNLSATMSPHCIMNLVERLRK